MFQVHFRRHLFRDRVQLISRSVFQIWDLETRKHEIQFTPAVNNLFHGNFLSSSELLYWFRGEKIAVLKTTWVSYRLQTVDLIKDATMRTCNFCPWTCHCIKSWFFSRVFVRLLECILVCRIQCRSYSDLSLGVLWWRIVWIFTSLTRLKVRLNEPEQTKLWCVSRR